MITFKLNDKTIQVPSSWEDLTFQQYIYILEGKATTLYDIIALFAGLDPEMVRYANITGLEAVISALSFLNHKPKFIGHITQIGKYKLPLNSKGEFNIQFETLAQFEDMRAVIKKIPPDNALIATQAYADYISIYLQKIRDGKYNYDEAMKMKDEVYQIPAHEVITAGSFFIVKLSNLLTGTPNSFQPTSQSQKKSKRVSASSKKRSVRSRRSLKRR